ncbi:cytochrome c oxidase cbb3-type subunit 3 [Pseudaminobacter salicylatoxidans]|uniref:Cbb3-type cytochrome c oxidase subunit n=1 Tax=Pseudaminobacter salicylatoxidans TaxID=93369 RepID=A0A316C0A9_PSESE|nr:cytochrome-c oxidase, cbb3-type subunit III [Pseudaminobacter salicylatoxidans]PWJ81012.1 cytochrome c oxidase cbb3-type subunit 3 [Pseudaminobacter salicylatoxidans]
MTKREIDEVSGVETTGHEWDGIKELNNPMPRWWLWTFYATIVWAAGYTIAYPAWPMISSATSGVLGFSSRGDLKAEMTAAETAKQDYAQTIAAKSADEILADDQLREFATAAGAAAFKVNCIQCHGSGAEGSAGFPNLNDDDWLWGGSADAIYHTIAHGIRFEGDPDTRYSEMPAFGDMLSKDEIRQVSSYVASLTGNSTDEQAAAAGKQVFADNCASCHGDDGTGDREFGAPNLADAIWLYGSSEAEIARQVRTPRHGMMPAWSARLGDTTVKELAVYVHSLGGGE